MAPRLPPSGEQFVLKSAHAHAVVTEVGATLRRLVLGGEDVVLSFTEDEMSGDGRGQVLAPWPNRLGDGRYRFEDVEGSVPLNEPDRRNAIHGLVRWQAFRPAMRSASEVLLETVLYPQPAYPWRLRLVVRYALSDDELAVAIVATNESGRPAPFGIGFHPYLAAPLGADKAAVDLPATRHLRLDDRGLPNGEELVADSPIAPLLGGAPLGNAIFDDCFAGLSRGADGRFTVSYAPDTAAGRRILVRGDEAFDYVMLYSADQLRGEERRGAVAIEPMTCPPDAFRTGESLVRLEPDEEFRAGYSLALGS